MTPQNTPEHQAISNHLRKVLDELVVDKALTEKEDDLDSAFEILVCKDGLFDMTPDWLRSLHSLLGLVDTETVLLILFHVHTIFSASRTGCFSSTNSELAEAVREACTSFYPKSLELAESTGLSISMCGILSSDRSRLENDIDKILTLPFPPANSGRVRSHVIHTLGKAYLSKAPWRQFLLGEFKRGGVETMAACLELIRLEGPDCPSEVIYKLQSLSHKDCVMKYHELTTVMAGHTSKTHSAQILLAWLAKCNDTWDALNVACMLFCNAFGKGGWISSVALRPGPFLDGDERSIYTFEVMRGCSTQVVRLNGSDFYWLEALAANEYLRVDSKTRKPIHTNLLNLFGIDRQWEDFVQLISDGLLDSLGAP